MRWVFLPPAEYKRSLGMNYDCGFKVGSNPKWAVMSVNRILSNEIYTGMMVQGINSKINYKIRESRPVPSITAQSGVGCSSHLINTDKLEQVVLETVQTEIRLLVIAENVLNQIYRMAIYGYVGRTHRQG